MIIMCTHNGNFPEWIGRLSYLVSIVATNELALRGARVSSTIELSISPQWNILIPATEALKSFFPIYIQVRFIMIKDPELEN